MSADETCQNMPNRSASVPKRNDTVMFSFTPFPKPCTCFSCLCKLPNFAFRQSAFVWPRIGHNLSRVIKRNVPKKTTSSKQSFLRVCVYIYVLEVNMTKEALALEFYANYCIPKGALL